MRAFVALCCILGASLAAGEGWPWPWHTTPAPSNSSAFGEGIAEALGFKDATACVTDMNTSFVDLMDAVHEYRQGGALEKAKALMHVGEAIEKATVGLAGCTSALSDAEKYKRLMKDLQDPRYYSVHNALTLSLNLAEDHKQLGAFAAAFDKGDFKTAGFELTNVVLDVLANPGIPSSNGTAAMQIALGLGAGIATGADVACFQGVSVEIPELIGGVLEVWTGVLTIKGIESIFHGLVGVVPTFKACLADRPKIVNLLHELGDLKDPAKLAKVIGQNILDNKLDLSLETASAVLDYKGGEWTRFGQDIGQILDKIVIASSLKAASWPWQPAKKPPSSNLSAFSQGVAEALGFKDVSTCTTNMNATAVHLWDAAQDYRRGGLLAKAKALMAMGQAVEEVTVGLGACASTMHDGEKYEQLMKYLKDPRYYTVHNALTLALNLAQDHAQLGAFEAALAADDFKTAGFDLTAVVLDVLENPGIPTSNGTAAAQIAVGLGSGLATGVEVDCFKDVIVEIPELVGGVFDVWTGVLIVKGVESIFHGLVGIVPTFKACLADKPKIVALLHELHDLKDPVGLAKIVGQNILDNKLDLSLETAAAVLDYKGGEWQRFGEDIGKILDKILIASSAQSDLIVI